MPGIRNPTMNKYVANSRKQQFISEQVPITTYSCPDTLFPPLFICTEFSPRPLAYFCFLETTHAQHNPRSLTPLWSWTELWNSKKTNTFQQNIFHPTQQGRSSICKTLFTKAALKLVRLSPMVSCDHCLFGLTVSSNLKVHIKISKLCYSGIIIELKILL